MARLLLINANTYNPSVNEIGDVVGFYKDTHIFDPNEEDKFDVMEVTNVDERELWLALKQEYPERHVWRMPKTNRNTWSLEQPEQKKVWWNRNDSIWRFQEIKPKYLFTTKDMNVLQKQLLADVGQDRLATLEVAKVAFTNRNTLAIENQTECTDIN